MALWFVFGQNSSGLLGIKTENEVTQLKEMELKPKEAVKEIISTPTQTLLLTVSGELYLINAASYPNQTTLRKFNTEKIIHVTSGYSHFVAISINKTVYTWGSGSVGQLGHGNKQTCHEPTKVLALNNKRAVSIHASYSTSFVICENGDLYAFGNGFFGEFGNGKNYSSLKPSLVQQEIVQLYSGLSYHLFAEFRNGEIKGWGRNDSGQLGQGTKRNQLTPLKMKFFKQKNIQSIFPGLNFTIALSTSQKIYSCGSGRNCGQQRDTTEFKEILFFSKMKIDFVSIGNEYTLVATTDRQLYGFGTKMKIYSQNNSLVQRPTITIQPNFQLISLQAGCSYSCFLKLDPPFDYLPKQYNNSSTYESNNSQGTKQNQTNQSTTENTSNQFSISFDQDIESILAEVTNFHNENYSTINPKREREKLRKEQEELRKKELELKEKQNEVLRQMKIYMEDENDDLLTEKFEQDSMDNQLQTQLQQEQQERLRQQEEEERQLLQFQLQQEEEEESLRQLQQMQQQEREKQSQQQNFKNQNEPNNSFQKQIKTSNNENLQKRHIDINSLQQLLTKEEFQKIFNLIKKREQIMGTELSELKKNREQTHQDLEKIIQNGYSQESEIDNIQNKILSLKEKANNNNITSQTTQNNSRNTSINKVSMQKIEEMQSFINKIKEIVIQKNKEIDQLKSTNNIFQDCIQILQKKSQTLEDELDKVKQLVIRLSKK
ncbi:hypothetical protein M0812_26338 [Anaeramoeba flamelloides]|uniref:RCC1-like domain-containing protein n=1 Tax=Anaeramoeba flamelloides TaxID=1746091 RepID=A0AAV7YCV5_9EUKA|nr:hypothetical protein M0812_26338 [Anaeramoeba flamelloides]